MSLVIAHAGRRDRRPEVFVGAAADALLDLVLIDLAGDLASELLAVSRDVVGMGFVEYRATKQLLGRAPDQGAELRIDPQKPSVGRHFGNADAGVLVGCG
jgi:hypothetical protein